MILRIKIAPIARKDLKEIIKYIRKQWGGEQQEKYTIMLDECFKLLAENPGVGRQRNEVKQGVISYPIGRHIVFYQINHTNLEILRITHQSNDIIKYP